MNSLSDTSVVLDYKFANETPSDATGTIKLSTTSGATGTYNLYWGNNSGILPDMSEMFSLTCSSGVLTASRTLVNGWMIPQEATKIYVKSSSDGVVYGFDLPINKIWNSSILGDKLYSFGIVSDIHCGTASSNSGYSLTNDIPAAWRYFNEQDVNFICSTGDVINGGVGSSEAQLTAFFNVTNDVTNNEKALKFYPGRGNHDCQEQNQSLWLSIMNLPKDLVIRYGDPSLTTYNGTISADIYRLDILETDMFIMQSVGTSYGSKPTNEDQQTKLTELLTNNKDKRIFYFMHVPMERTVGDPFSAYDLQNGAYPQIGTTYYNWFMNLMANNRNVIFFNGHTHFQFEDALNDPNTIVYDDNGTYGWFIHIPSLGIPREWTTGISYHTSKDRSQGGIVDVYKDYIIIRGRDFGTINEDNLQIYDIQAHNVPVGQIILKNKI